MSMFHLVGREILTFFLVVSPALCLPTRTTHIYVYYRHVCIYVCTQMQMYMRMYTSWLSLLGLWDCMQVLKLMLQYLAIHHHVHTHAHANNPAKLDSSIIMV